MGHNGENCCFFYCFCLMVLVFCVGTFLGLGGNRNYCRMTAGYSYCLKYMVYGGEFFVCWSLIVMINRWEISYRLGVILVQRRIFILNYKMIFCST